MLLCVIFWDDIKKLFNLLKDKAMVQFKSNVNNPFNIRANKANKWKGKTTPEGASFEHFQSIEMGIRAGIITLQTYFKKYRVNTVNGIISRFAPSTENDTENYIKFVADQVGVSPNNMLVPDKETLWRLSKAITAMENGYQLNRSDYEKAFRLV